MNRKTILIAFFLLFAASRQLVGQSCNSYTCKMELARTALLEGHYRSALDQALGALYYDQGKKAEVDLFIDEVYRAIEEKRKEAETQRNAARLAEENLKKEQIKLIRALNMADSLRNLAEDARSDALKSKEVAIFLLSKAQQQEEEAKMARMRADSSLELYRKRSAEIVNLYMKEVNRLILDMNYEAAADTLVVAAAFGNPTKLFRRGLTELAFWFNEAGIPEAAAEIIEKCGQGNPAMQEDSIRKFLSAYNAEWVDSMKARYLGDMVYVKGGGFVFGYKTQASVKDFFMARTELTFWQYALFCTSKGRSLAPFKEPGWEHRGDEPMINISIWDAAEYYNWLSEKSGLKQVYLIDPARKKILIDPSADGFRLPYEKEWEYAAKGGVFHQNFNYSGSSNNEAMEVGWVPDNSTRTRPVGRKKPNILGLYDMTGNIKELCLNRTYKSLKNPGFLVIGLNRSMRSNSFKVKGGCWKEKSTIINSPNLLFFSKKSNTIGFRTVKNTSGSQDSITSHPFKNLVSISHPPSPKTGDSIPINIEPVLPFKSVPDKAAADINLQILHMDYALANTKISALSTEEKKSEWVRKSILETAFWWNESGQVQTAATLLADSDLGRITPNADSIRAFLKKLDPDWFTRLTQRYYGETVPVAGASFTFHYKTAAAVSSFQMSRTEITNWQYGLFLASRERSPKEKSEPEFEFRGDKPLVNINWFEALEYANWLSEKTGRTPVYKIIKGRNWVSSKNIVAITRGANGFRLPTETEWEFAAKGGASYAYSIYAGSDYFDEVAWGPKNCDSPQPVALKKPNKLGIYDLSGNVAEWCWDRDNGANGYPKTFKYDYQGAQTGSIRIIRGGSWKNQAELTNRRFKGSRLSPYHSNNKTGFRLVAGF